MSGAADQLIADGLAAWMAGDLDTLETVLDPQVRLLGVQGGPWDCTGREQVMQLLRLRQGQVGPPPPAVRIERVDDHTFIVSTGITCADPDPEPVATRVTVTDDKVTRMEQYHPTADLSLPQDGTGAAPTTSADDDRATEAAVDAIHTGDLPTLTRLLADYPHLATARFTTRGGRTLLHVATDWPGHFPDAAATVRALTAAGADVNAAATGRHAETPLHWAASSNDVDALDALLDAGADINALGGAIGNASPLFNATAFGQWQAARRLLDRGARAGLWEAAVMGLLPQVTQHFSGQTQPSQEDIDDAFWGACHGGQRDTSTYLLSRGADINRVGWDDLTPLRAAERSNADELADWLRDRGAHTTPSDH